MSIYSTESAIDSFSFKVAALKYDSIQNRLIVIRNRNIFQKDLIMWAIIIIEVTKGGNFDAAPSIHTGFKPSATYSQAGN